MNHQSPITNHQSGFSLIEALFASSIFGLAITALAGALVFGQQASLQAGARARATDLAIEGIEGVRNIRDQAFNELRFNQSGIDSTGGEWDFLGESTTETIDIFTRTIEFAEVCRDASDEIATCPASYTDPHTEQVTATVSWEPKPGATAEVTRTTYLTNWDTSLWTQTDWSGGSGQAEWSDATKYDTDDGNVDVSTAGEAMLASISSTPANWWDTNYGYREKITFGTAHSTLPQYFTATFSMDTQAASTNVELASGDDIRIVWQPTSGPAVELDRLGDTWDNAATTISFRLQSEIGANLDEDVDGSYYVYYGNASAGTPPANEMNVYYFADFFNRANSSTIGNGWTEWTTGGGNMSISSNGLFSAGNNTDPADAGIKQNFGLGAIAQDFTVEFDWTMPSNSEGIWTHYVNIGSSMSDSSRVNGVGPGIYNGEGGHFSPNSTENISNDLSGNMENNVSGGPHAIKLVVDYAAKDYDYYRNGTLRASNQNWVNTGVTLDQIRIANDQYISSATPFGYDNVKVYLNVADDAEETVGSEESQASVTESGYATGNLDMSSNALLLHLNESAGSTTFSDSSGLGNDATCSGATCPTAGSVGRFNEALDFDGSDDFIGVPSSSELESGNNLTASAWVNIDSVTSPNHNPILWKGTQIGWGANYMFRIAVNSGGNMTWGVTYGSTEDWFAAGSITLNEWNHVALTYDGNIARAYINGVEVGDSGGGGSSLNTFSSEPIRSGLAYRSTPAEETHLDGQVDEIGIWGRTFSGTEIEDLYRRGALRLTYQVRSCDDVACSGESFIGPDGTSGTFYSELDNSTLAPPVDIPLSNIVDNRYFQYQITFETDDSSLSPELESVTIGYSGGGAGSYQTSGSLLSSAFNMGDASPAQTIEWDEVIPSCTPICSIQFQVRTAPDSGGSPGAWTNWYGASGDGTYFTSAPGSLIPVELNGNQWVQYRVELAGDGTDTPVLEEVRVSYR